MLQVDRLEPVQDVLRGEPLNHPSQPFKITGTPDPNAPPEPKPNERAPLYEAAARAVVESFTRQQWDRLSPETRRDNINDARVAVDAALDHLATLPRATRRRI